MKVRPWLEGQTIYTPSPTTKLPKDPIFAVLDPVIDSEYLTDVLAVSRSIKSPREAGGARTSLSSSPFRFRCST